MSFPEEHDYIGLTDSSSMENPSSSSIVSTESEKNSVLNLKETELRLGLPGSDFHEKKAGTGVSLFGKDLKDEVNNGFSQILLKNFVSGAKRVFSDAIDESGKWGFPLKGGSEVDMENCGSENTNTLQCSLAGPSGKEIGNSNPAKLVEDKKNENNSTAPASKAQVLGWPPIQSFRKNTLATTNLSKNNDDVEGKSGLGCLYVKVSMDGAPYLRKINLKTYCSYAELSSFLGKMFSCFTIGQYASHGLPGQEHLRENCLKNLLHGSEYVLTYEDKDGDWMLVGDVPWEMFTDSCKRLRIMKGSDATGLAPRAMQKCKNQS
ncbi:auxin-responsive IAA27-like [Olea europaea subsp. europaea]|uniref:Auxin-responsive protein n=2 Tax=Olea europaea subsp. europaea TaxID=158383 RepID=A0A8S0QAU0_OLEEU|nr:auxin-responsive IAA27-like [Olea europaea subsp. europaea]